MTLIMTTVTITIVTKTITMILIMRLQALKALSK